MKHTSYKNRLRSGFVQLGDEKEKEHLNADYSWRTGGSRGDKALLLEVHSNMTRGNGKKLELEVLIQYSDVGFF